jgi:Protein of unknown function (DUF1552)
MNVSRRQVLRGAGGFTLALPFLHSLFRSTRADAAVPTTRRFVQFASSHGGVWGANMYPGAGTLTESTQFAGRTVRRGALTLATQGADALLSPVLRAPSSVLTPQLASKMNVLRGLDIPFYIAHHTGGHLGNFARNDGNGSDGTAMQAFPTPTIDQLMAWSPSFYPSLATVKERSLQIGSGLSYNWSNPQTRSGPIQPLTGNKDALDLFNRIFVPPTKTGEPDPNAQLVPVVDRVLEDYKRLREGNRRLGADDRRRLDDHMQRLAELERRLKVHPSCNNVSPVTTNTNDLQNQSTYGVTPASQAQVYGVLNDVIVAAMLCDTSRIAVVHVDDTFSGFPGDWHQDVAHRANADAQAQQTLATAHQQTFARTFLDLASKLNVDDGTGRTYLDDALIVWTQECGEYTHMGQGIPVITAGSAGGFLKTGNYCDYRNPAIVIDDGNGGNPNTKIFGGILYHQWLGTALQAMGLAPSEYEANGVRGYPTKKFVGNDFYGPASATQAYPDALWNASSGVIPFLKA